MGSTNKFWLSLSLLWHYLSRGRPKPKFDGVGAQWAVARSMLNKWDIIYVPKTLEVTDNYQLVEGRFIEKIFIRYRNLVKCYSVSKRGKGGLVTELEGGEWGSAGGSYHVTYGYQESKRWSWVSFKASHFMIWLAYLEIGEHYEGEYRDNRQVCDHWACWCFPIKTSCYRCKNLNMKKSLILLFW